VVARQAAEPNLPYLGEGPCAIGRMADQSGFQP
jgi:hypothetical protein